MTFQTVCLWTQGPRKPLFQKARMHVREAWLKVLLLQQGPRLNWEGVMIFIFPRFQGPGVMLNA
jgi:hypothetical protein